MAHSSHSSDVFCGRREWYCGEVVVQEDPYAMITPETYSAVACALCGHIPDAAKGEQIFGVAATDPIRYCSQACLLSDASVHELESQAVASFSTLAVEGSTEAIRLVIRMAAQKQLEVAGLKMTLGTPEFPSWGGSNLFGHVMSLEAPTESIDAESLGDIEMVSEVLGQLLQEAGLPLGAEEVLHLLLSIQSNAHRVVDSDKRCVGLGAFPFISMLNHSCCPNCSHHFVLKQGRSPSLVMVAIDDIAEGDELCYNYVPLYQSTERRRLQLNSAYSFTCDCRRCTEASAPPTVFDTTALPTFPRDHILSEVDVISANDSSEPGLIDDGHSDVTLNFHSIIPCSGKTLHSISTEIAMCNKLLASATAAANTKACKSVVKKIITFFSDEKKAGSLHPCHELILSAYVTCAKGCELLLSQHEQQLQTAPVLTVEEEFTFSHAAVGLGGLALGCIIMFTGVRNDDVSELERIIGAGLRCCERRAEKREECGSSERCSSLFSQAGLSSLANIEYFWSPSSDSRGEVISNLLAASCSYAAGMCTRAAFFSLSEAFLTSHAKSAISA